MDNLLSQVVCIAALNRSLCWIAEMSSRLFFVNIQVNKFAKYATSLVMSIVYLISNNNNLLVAYYVYSMALNTLSINYLFMLHHAASLICITIGSDHPDYHRVMLATYWLKLGDLFSYWPKIASSLYVEMNPITLSCMVIHVIMSLTYRVLFPFTLYPFAGYILILAVGFHTANVWWLYRIVIKYSVTASKWMMSNKHVRVTTPERVDNLEF